MKTWQLFSTVWILFILSGCNLGKTEFNCNEGFEAGDGATALYTVSPTPGASAFTVLEEPFNLSDIRGKKVSRRRVEFSSGSNTRLKILTTDYRFSNKKMVLQDLTKGDNTCITDQNSLQTLKPNRVYALIYESPQLDWGFADGEYKKIENLSPPGKLALWFGQTDVRAMAQCQVEGETRESEINQFPEDKSHLLSLLTNQEIVFKSRMSLCGYQDSFSKAVDKMQSKSYYSYVGSTSLNAVSFKLDDEKVEYKMEIRTESKWSSTSYEDLYSTFLYCSYGESSKKELIGSCLVKAVPQ